MNSNYRLPNPNYQPQQQQQQSQWSQKQQFGPGGGISGISGANRMQMYNHQQQNLNQNNMHQPPPPQQNFPSPRPQQLLPPEVLSAPEQSSFPPLLPPPMPPAFPWQIDIPLGGDDTHTQPYIKVGENGQLSINTGRPEVKKLNLLLYEDIIDQNLPKELRDLFQGLFCKLCSLTLSSPKVAREHYSGKRHLKSINEWLEKNKTATDQNIQGYIRLATDKPLTPQQQQPKVAPPPPPPPPPPPLVPQPKQMGNNYNQNLQQQQPQQFGNNYNQNLQQQRSFAGDINHQQQGPNPRPFTGGGGVNQQQFPGQLGPGSGQGFQNPNFYNQQQQNFNRSFDQNQQQQPRHPTQQNFNNPNFNANNTSNKPPIPSLLSQPHLRPPNFQSQEPNSSFDFNNRKRPFQGPSNPSSYGGGDQELLRCETCNIILKNQASLDQHLNGKNHRARLQGQRVPDKKDRIINNSGQQGSRSARRKRQKNFPSSGNANLEPLGGGGGGRFNFNDEPPILIKR